MVSDVLPEAQYEGLTSVCEARYGFLNPVDGPVLRFNFCGGTKVVRGIWWYEALTYRPPASGNPKNLKP